MFLTKPWEEVKHLLGGLSHAEEAVLTFAIKTTDALVKYDQAHPETADLITALIPGEADDRFKEIARVALPKILVDLRLVEALQQTKGVNEIIIAANQTLAAMDHDVRNSTLHSISTLLARAATPGTLWSKIIIAVEKLVQVLHKKEPAATTESVFEASANIDTTPPRPEDMASKQITINQ